MSFNSLKRILPQVIASRGLTQQVRIRMVLQTAGNVLVSLWGKERAGYLEPVSFKEGVLKYTSTSAVAQQQMKLDEVTFLNELNRRLEERVVHRLEVRAKGF